MKSNKNHIQRMVGVALLAAVVVVLQYFVVIPLGPFAITLTLVPIMIGAMLFGPTSGALLGATFGVVVCIQVMTGAAGAYSTAMFSYAPMTTMLVCLTKGVVAGLVTGLVYRPFVRMGRAHIGAWIAAAVCPICNTGIFSLALLTVYNELATGWAVDQKYAGIFTFLLFFMIGWNFLIEFAVNVLLAPVSVRIIEIVKKKFRY